VLTERLVQTPDNCFSSLHVSFRDISTIAGDNEWQEAGRGEGVRWVSHQYLTSKVYDCELFSESVLIIGFSCLIFFIGDRSTIKNE
jgi:hypothetical protein